MAQHRGRQTQGHRDSRLRGPSSDGREATSHAGRLGAFDYQNRRKDYVVAVIDNLLNWEFAIQNLVVWTGQYAGGFRWLYSSASRGRVDSEREEAFAFPSGLAVSVADGDGVA